MNARKQALRRGLGFLADTDLLTSQSSPHQTPWQPAFNYRTSFVPALILNCLASVPDSQALQPPLAAFLLQQKSAHWSFNYWDRHSPAARDFPYPDDLDDSFCALIALRQHDPQLVDQAALAQIVHLLVACESRVGGPYRTWLSPSAGWQDVDIAVNANIARFMQLIDTPLPKLTDYLTKHLSSGRLTSKYYPSVWPIYYYLAQACPEASRPVLSKAIQRSLKTTPSMNHLELSLALSALCHLAAGQSQLASLCRQITERQQADGSWPAAAFCLDPSRNQQTHYHGSAALSTAFALEALALFGQRQAQAERSTGQRTKPDPAEALHQSIITTARSDLSRLKPDLRRPALAALDQTLNSDPRHQITLLPYWFGQSLHQRQQPSDALCRQLGLANLWGWLAYTIYDDFLDGEAVPPRLPVANVAMRRSLLQFLAALPDPAFRTAVRRTFDTIDTANCWEVSQCRNPAVLPHYGQRSKLADRSLGHCLGPMAILVAAGHRLTDPPAKDIVYALRQYLIARQLDDDCHDWQADLAANRITYVVGQQLKHQPTPQQFWDKTLPAVCATMERHIAAGQQALANNPLLKPDNIVSQLLAKTQASVQQTLATRRQAAEFLASYQSTPNQLLKTN